MKYSIVSGYHWSEKSSDFFNIWRENIRNNAPDADRVFVIGDSGASIPPTAYGSFQQIELTGNLGSFMNLINGEKPHRFNGWTGVVLAGAMLCYCNESDMVFVEQDCLIFGDCIGKMREEIGESGIIFGNCSFMECEQSFFMVRHNYLTEFVRLITGEPAQNCEANQGEQMFSRLQRRCPDQWRRFSMGVGRDHFDQSFNDGRAFYAQKFNDNELAWLKEWKLI